MTEVTATRAEAEEEVEEEEDEENGGDIGGEKEEEEKGRPTTSNGAPDTMKTNSNERDAPSKEMRAKNKTSSPATGVSPKKRRKVNHAYDLRPANGLFAFGLVQERPCTRCIKRNIGHLCHDEPREPTKKAKSERDVSTAEEETPPTGNGFQVSQGRTTKAEGQGTSGQQQLLPETTLGLQPSSMDPPQAVQSQNITSQGLDNNSGQVLQYNDWQLGRQNQFHDMHTLHPSYMFNAPEVTNEYNLLSDFLNTSLLDDSGMYQGNDLGGLYSDPSLFGPMMQTLDAGNEFVQQQQQQQPQQSVSQLAAPPNQLAQGNSIQRPASTAVNDKAKETYYLTAADPAGTDTPEERMNKLLKAKYDAGMLKPFNYVKGYARLNQYMEKHIRPSSRQKILRQLDKFRPKFRERMQSLTDIELVFVEMWFERSLMEYDRVFASMAIPACCWRRTGEIYRGNQEMAQLIDVPMQTLRDGKLALHEIIVEDQLVSYWEKFGAIAFDNTQKAMLTSCTLKNPNVNNPGQGIQCCFSFTIRRDPHNIPSLIIGNFLPTKRLDR
ncbi:hypothetical protein FQN54_004192 [Arachnomyces sp. PD_36]|nr:hypothetical protein FQN54_004192 [Arachnomyces sp. PD_36]